MRRSSILVTILLFYLLVSAGLLNWAYNGWQASPSIAQASVLGTSTDTTITTTTIPSLNAYPTLAQSAIDSLTNQAGQIAIYHKESGTLLYSTPNARPVPIASTTKMMTAFLAVKYGSPDQILTISSTATNQIPSTMGLLTDEKISLQNILTGTLMVSGNDAAYAIGEHIGEILLNNLSASSQEKVDRFVQEMNKEAALLYMTNTHYADPAGLSDEKGYSTASDLAKLASLLIDKPLVKTIITTPLATVYSQNNAIRHDLINSNRLVNGMNYQGILGVKTGYTPTAGHCLVAAASRGGATYIVVVLNTNAALYPDNNVNDISAIAASKLLDAAFSATRFQ